MYVVLFEQLRKEWRFSKKWDTSRGLALITLLDYWKFISLIFYALIPSFFLICGVMRQLWQSSEHTSEHTSEQTLQVHLLKKCSWNMNSFWALPMQKLFCVKLCKMPQNLLKLLTIVKNWLLFIHWLTKFDVGD